jgi:hypothetical protein
MLFAQLEAELRGVRQELDDARKRESTLRHQLEAAEYAVAVSRCCYRHRTTWRLRRPMIAVTRQPGRLLLWRIVERRWYVIPAASASCGWGGVRGGILCVSPRTLHVLASFTRIDRWVDGRQQAAARGPREEEEEERVSSLQASNISLSIYLLACGVASL